jgi:ankyrin repeat protein
MMPRQKIDVKNQVETEQDTFIIPDDYLCPITREIMLNPVSTCDGQTYEKEAIEQWLENHNTSPLTNAVLANKTLIPNVLVKKLVNEFIEKNRSFFKIPFLDAAQRGEDQTLQSLLKLGVKIDIRDDFGFTALQLAASGGHNSTVQLLINRGADIKAAVDNSDLSNRMGQLQQQAQALDQQMRRQQQPELRQAYSKLQEKIQKLAVIQQRLQQRLQQYNQYGQILFNSIPFRERGESSTITEQQALFCEGQTALHLAAAKGHGSTVNLLLDRDANIDAKDQDNSTPLHLAAAKGHDSTVNLLLDAGADIDAKDQDNSTPLHLAAMNQHKQVVMLLIKRGADHKIKNRNGQIPGSRSTNYDRDVKTIKDDMENFIAEESKKFKKNNRQALIDTIHQMQQTISQLQLQVQTLTLQMQELLQGKAISPVVQNDNNSPFSFSSTSLTNAELMRNQGLLKDTRTSTDPAEESPQCYLL